jgi:hypothetical protein
MRANCGIVFKTVQPFETLTKLLAYDELQPRPHVGDRTNFDVNETERQRQLANHVLSDRGGHLG